MVRTRGYGGRSSGHVTNKGSIGRKEVRKKQKEWNFEFAKSSMSRDHLGAKADERSGR